MTGIDADLGLLSKLFSAVESRVRGLLTLIEPARISSELAVERANPGANRYSLLL